MQTSAVILSDYYAKPIQKTNGGRWAKGTKLSSSMSANNADVDVIKWQLAKEEEEYQKVLEKEKFAKKRLTMDEFFNLYKHVDGVRGRLDNGTRRGSRPGSNSSSGTASTLSMTRETFLSGSRSGSGVGGQQRGPPRSARGSAVPMRSARGSAVPIRSRPSVVPNLKRQSAVGRKGLSFNAAVVKNSCIAELLE
jgi:hypothetical protein